MIKKKIHVFKLSFITQLMVQITKILILLSISFLPSFVNSQDEHNKKAFAIDLILKFIEWPKELDNNQQFIIGVINDDIATKSFDNFFQKRLIKNKKVKVINIQQIEQIKNCNCLYISNNASPLVTQIISFVQKKPILTLTDCFELSNKGILLYFFYENETIKRVINREAVNNSGLVFRYYLFENSKVLQSGN